MAKRKRYDDYLLLAAGEGVSGCSTRYLIERVVGLGAFAAVYFARDPATPGRQIALKEFFAARHSREQADLQALFERERKVGILASPHPLMPTFYEAFEDDSHFYIAQEFIEGGTLDEIITRRHPLPREWVLKWAISLCDALAFLHSRQVVHHDLKPANIRITPQGHLALLDFGAAQYFGAGHEEEAPVEMYGTEGYLPPELEADGEWVADARTDTFALGCILYEMVAGIAPDQETINARSMYVTNALIQSPYADLNLIKLINTALSYNTDYRYHSANDFLLELRKIAPPVLLVSKKHLRFGEVNAGSAAAPRTVTIYNAGGGEVRGEIKPRAPWIIVPSNAFRGNRRDVEVKIDTAKIPQRGEIVTGRLEINMADQHDADGQIISAGDRWFIECSVTVTAKPGYLEVQERSSQEASAISVTGRKGQSATGTFAIKNSGELAVDFSVGAARSQNSQISQDALLTLAVDPPRGQLAQDEARMMTVSIPTQHLSLGRYDLLLSIQTSSNQVLTVPLVLRVLSSLDYLKTRIVKK